MFQKYLNDVSTIYTKSSFLVSLSTAGNINFKTFSRVNEISKMKSFK